MSCQPRVQLRHGNLRCPCRLSYEAKRVNECDFHRFYPDGFIGRRLSQTLDAVMTVAHLPIVRENEGTHYVLVIMNEPRLGTLSVIDDDGQLNDIVADGNIQSHVVQGSSALDEPVKGIMTRNPIKIARSVSVANAMGVMERHAITVLPAVDEEEKLLGVVNFHELPGRGKFGIMNTEGDAHR